jgi:putative DNA primase/helicase
MTARQVEPMPPPPELSEASRRALDAARAGAPVEDTLAWADDDGTVHSDGPAAEVNDPMPGEPRSELGYARRLVHIYGDRLRYVPAWRRWLVWDGHRWAHDSTGQAARWAKVIARRLTLDAMAIPDTAERRSALHAARRGESSAGVAGALTLASTEPGIAVTPDELDADPFLLNCANGTFDLRTLSFRPADPADLLTKITGAAYHPDATGQAFAQFLERVQPDPRMRAYLARLFGHALEGRVSEHLLPICWGDGANGKGTFINAVLAALGDYADAADPELLTARTFDAHPTGNADLFGLRLAVLHEGDAGRRLAEGTVKRLTGGDRIKARRMREDFWHFDPSHLFVMLTNHKPIITGTDEGIWRRTRLLPWPEVIPEEERDEHLGDRLALEKDAVLGWLVAGYRDWRQLGRLAEPDQVTQATAKYRADSDAIGRFIDGRCLLAAGYRTRSAELYGEWCKWCATEGEEPGTNKAFTTALQNRGHDIGKTNVGMVWKGIGLAADDEHGDEK